MAPRKGGKPENVTPPWRRLVHDQLRFEKGKGTVSSLFFLLGRGPSTTTGLPLAPALYLVKQKLHERSGTRRHELAPPNGDLCYLGTLQNRKMCITK